MLALLGLAESLGMSLWFVGSAAAPQLRVSLALSDAQVGWLTTAVQLGFVGGTALVALFNLADLIPAARFFTGAALLGAAANLLLLTAPDANTLLVSRALTGAALAGVYPPAMKMAATWFREQRGLAVGVIVGALTVGKAGPYLAHLLPGLSVATLVGTASASAVLAAALIGFGYREGPYPFPPRPFRLALVGDVVRDRRWRLALGGYLGHMTELYAYWTWIPTFVAASLAAAPYTVTAPVGRRAALLGFAIIAVGGLGCVWGGWVADKIGRERLVIRALAISGACCAGVGFAFGRSLWLLVPLALVWGFFIIADSAQFSVLVTESVPPHAVGTALSAQLCLGFLLTTLTIQTVPWIVTHVGWPRAFTALALGPLAGIIAIRRLATTPAHA
ncbi:MAG: MFS transporter [Gemmatimonadaceae bacterium]|nr:MFS transporter [Gemmatimonadaceae bacterium]